jgi:hypothetical protein
MSTASSRRHWMRSSKRSVQPKLCALIFGKESGTGSGKCTNMSRVRPIWSRKFTIPAMLRAIKFGVWCVVRSPYLAGMLNARMPFTTHHSLLTTHHED